MIQNSARVLRLVQEEEGAGEIREREEERRRVGRMSDDMIKFFKKLYGDASPPGIMSEPESMQSRTLTFVGVC